MKASLVAILTAWLCAGCAQSNTPRTDGSSFTMYGTLDQGVTFRK